MLITDNDYTWCREEVLNLVQQFGEAGIWENRIYQLMCRTEGWARKSWAETSPGQRAIRVSSALSVLLGNTRIESIPEKAQATGRRCFRPVNILDSIVAALEAAEND